MTCAGLTAPSLLAAGLLGACLLASCVAPPLYVGPPRPIRTSSHADPAEPGYSGLISNGVARRRARRELTTNSEVPRDALGNAVLPDAGQATAAKPARHRRKHWFGL